VTILKEADVGVPIGELRRRLEVSEGTLDRWKTKRGGLEHNEARGKTDPERLYRELQR